MSTNDEQTAEGQEITLVPPTPDVEQDADSQWMNWTVVSKKTVLPADIKELEKSIAVAGHAVEIASPEPHQLRIRIEQRPIANYTDLYDACLRALLISEARLGELESINGTQREKWWATFVVARHRWKDREL